MLTVEDASCVHVCPQHPASSTFVSEFVIHSTIQGKSKLPLPCDRPLQQHVLGHHAYEGFGGALQQASQP